MNRAAVTLSVALLCACGSPPPAADPSPEAATHQPGLVGKPWTSTDPFAASGMLRVFLPDGTLLMDSCGETYRLARWRTLDAQRIEWTEDAARIEAHIVRLTDDELQLRLQLAGEVKDERYRLAQVPAVCPDLPR